MSDLIKMVTDASFDADVLSANKPVLVDFWAQWCGPCRALMPIFEDVAATYGESVVFAKINIDENPQTPSKYGVMSIPTLILFKNGLVHATRMGSMTKSELSAFLDANV
jgi:thioredoxin 1